MVSGSGPLTLYANQYQSLHFYSTPQQGLETNSALTKSKLFVVVADSFGENRKTFNAQENTL